MAIAYIPSEGSIEKVGIRGDGIWFGQSVGGAALPKIKTNEEPNRGNYFQQIYSNLDSSSIWFFNDITDFNFVNGITLYRCIYIGADERFDENEIVGEVSVGVSNNGPSAVDSAINIDIIYDGTYTSFTSRGSRVLSDEQDKTGVLASRTDWSSSVTRNEVLTPGNYHKYWIRIQFVKDPSLVNFVDFQFFFTIKDLTIPVQRTNGRLNFSRVFTMDLRDPNLTLKASIPRDFDIDNIIKVIEHIGLTYVFYYKENNLTDLNLLVIQRDAIVENNKYINIDLSQVVPNIIQDNNFYENFSECCSTSPTSGTPTTSGGPATQPTSSDPCVFKPITSEFDDLVGTRFLIDIFSTLKDDSNEFYIFFNTFLSDTTDEFITKYGHKNYYWNTGLVNIDLNNINASFFASIETGYDNTRTVQLTEQYETVVLDRFRTNGIILQDDLFTGIGQIPEDCRIENNNSRIWYLFEGDIIKREPNVQLFNIPQVMLNELLTVPNLTNTDNYLLFNPELVDVVNFKFTRSVDSFEDGTEYVIMGPPHQKRLHHGFSEVSYDMNQELDEFSSTWGFGIESDSIVIGETQPTTSCPTSSQPSSGSDSVSTSGTSGTSGCPLDLDPNEFHVKLQSDFGNSGDGDYNLNYINQFVGVFNLHCNGDQELSALRADYNFSTCEWKVHVEDNLGLKKIVQVSSGPKLSTSHENVITLNIFRQQDYGCYKKYLVQYSINVNGVELINGVTYTNTTTDVYSITHNYENDFSGWVSYWEIRNYLELEAEKYADSMFRIHSNIAWGELEQEVENKDIFTTGLKHFNFRRNILINNLNWNQNEDILFPIVLQGTGYQIDSKYNKEVRRSVFDFSRIDINNKSFAFTYEGTTNKLQWVVGDFDGDLDILVVWVRLENWNGQRLTMYYSDSRLFVDEQEFNRPFEDYYAFWNMEKVVRIPRNRFVSQNIFNGGEAYITTKDSNNQESLIFINRQYQFGVDQIYKSNYFDIEWDDRLANRDTTNSINEFIEENIKHFKPDYMTLRKTKGRFPYKLETDNNNETRGASSNNGLIIGPQPPEKCRQPDRS